jgi:triacylglycerol lipase
MQIFKAWFLDTIFAICGFIQMYLYRNPPEKYLQHDEDKSIPILIIQGYMDRWGFIKSLADKISDCGFQVYVLPELKNNLDDIASSANYVNKYILDKKLKNVIIVGHSKGGLIGKYLIVNEKDRNKIIGLISISTPFLGSRMANLFRFLKSNQFEPDNKLIKELWSHHEVNKRIIAIFPKVDNVVWTKKSYLEGAKENIYLNTYGHHRILFDKKAQNKIIESINSLINTYAD